MEQIIKLISTATSSPAAWACEQITKKNKQNRKSEACKYIRPILNDKNYYTCQYKHNFSSLLAFYLNHTARKLAKKVTTTKTPMALVQNVSFLISIMKAFILLFSSLKLLSTSILNTLKLLSTSVLNTLKLLSTSVLNILKLLSKSALKFSILFTVVNLLAIRITNIFKLVNFIFTQTNKKLKMCIYIFLHKLSETQGVYAQ